MNTCFDSFMKRNGFPGHPDDLSGSQRENIAGQGGNCCERGGSHVRSPRFASANFNSFPLCLSSIRESAVRTYDGGSGFDPRRQGGNFNDTERPWHPRAEVVIACCPTWEQVAADKAMRHSHEGCTSPTRTELQSVRVSKHDNGQLIRF